MAAAGRGCRHCPGARLAAGLDAGPPARSIASTRFVPAQETVLIRPALLPAARVRPDRRRVPASLALATAGVLLIAATNADGGQPASAPAAPDLPAAVQAASTTIAPVAPNAPPTPVAFAAIDGVELLLPAAQVVAHGFHEPGGGGPEALTPMGTLQTAETNGFDEADAIADPSGPDYLVLPTRHRGTSPTGAVDVVVEEGEDVLAPVDGVVTTVADYALYGTHEDTLVHIRPHAAPHLEVKMLHVADVSVREGDAVVAGETVIADTARRVPVRNQIDRFVDRPLPHVHLEVLSSVSVG